MLSAEMATSCLCCVSLPRPQLQVGENYLYLSAIYFLSIKSDISEANIIFQKLIWLRVALEELNIFCCVLVFKNTYLPTYLPLCNQMKTLYIVLN